MYRFLLSFLFLPFVFLAAAETESFKMRVLNEECSSIEKDFFSDLKIFPKPIADVRGEEKFLKDGSKDPRASPSLIENSRFKQELHAFALPEESPELLALDKIFSVKGVLTSVESLEAAGFKIICHRKNRGLIVAKHLFLKGYLLKLYLDTDQHLEGKRWLKRAQGSVAVRNVLAEYKSYAKYLKAPRKWIYKIAKLKRGESTGENSPKKYVLLVDDMKIVDEATNLRLYQENIPYKVLDALFHVIKKSGYSDSHAANLPFCRDGKIAFIDTEFPKWPVHPQWLTKVFNPDRKLYWESLIANDSSE